MAFAHRDLIMLFPVHQGHLFPVTLFSAGRSVHVGDILRQLVAVGFVPVADAYHLPDVAAFPANLFLQDDSILYLETPVVGTFLLDAEEIGGVVILPDDGRVGDQQVRFEHIGIGEHVTGHQRGTDVIRLVIHGVFQELNHRILIEKLIKELSEVTAHDVDFIDPGLEAGIDQVVDDPDAMNADERLRGIQGDRNKTCSKAGRDEDCAFGPVGFQGGDAVIGDAAVRNQALFRQLLQDTIDRAKAVAGEFFKFTLGERPRMGCQNLQHVKLFSRQFHCFFSPISCRSRV